MNALRLTAPSPFVASLLTASPTGGRGIQIGPPNRDRCVARSRDRTPPGERLRKLHNRRDVGRQDILPHSHPLQCLQRTAHNGVVDITVLVRAQLQRQCRDAAGLIELIGEDNIYLEIDDGVTAFVDRSSTEG